MLVCYLDDSGTTKDTPFICISGYIGRYLDWQAFEFAAAPIFKREAVRVLEGKKLYHGKEDFKGWKVERKLSFVRDLLKPLKLVAPFGVSYLIEKEQYEFSRKRDRVNHSESAYGYCFRIVLDVLIRSRFVYEESRKRGFQLDIVLEQGNKNNSDVVRIFKKHLLYAPYGRFLGKLSIREKDSTKSLQMADLLAFNMRRYAVACHKADEFLPFPPILNEQILSGIPIGNMIVNDFAMDVGEVPFSESISQPPIVERSTRSTSDWIKTMRGARSSFFLAPPS